MAHSFRIISASPALRSSRSNRFGHIVRDSLIALAVFALLAAVVGWNAVPPQPIPAGDLLVTGANALPPLRGEQNIPQTTAALNTMLSLPQPDTRALFQPTNRSVTMAILASVFAAIISFNLWFLRHLGRVSASSRPGSVTMSNNHIRSNRTGSEP